MKLRDFQKKILTGGGSVLEGAEGALDGGAGGLGAVAGDAQGGEPVLAGVGPLEGAEGLPGGLAVLLGGGLAEAGLDEDGLAVGEGLCKNEKKKFFFSPRSIGSLII